MTYKALPNSCCKVKWSWAGPQRARCFRPDRWASREHGAGFVDDGVLFVEDLGSHNGTFANGQRIIKHELQKGDLVRLGVTQFTVDERGGEDTSIVRSISDSHPMTPLLVLAVEPNTSRVPSGAYAGTRSLTRHRRRSHHAARDRWCCATAAKNAAFSRDFPRSRTARQRYNDLRDTLPGLFDLVLKAHERRPHGVVVAG